jgi:hypothetical protein
MAEQADKSKKKEDEQVDEGNEQEGKDSSFGTFEQFLDSQGEEIKTALASERETRQELLRELAGKADKGSDLEKQLNDFADKLASSDRKTTFYEDAHGQGVSNLKLAWHIVNDEKLFQRDGAPNMNELKTRYPELFVKSSVSAPKTGDAGKGTGQPGPQSGGMNDFIRRAAGRT